MCSLKESDILVNIAENGCTRKKHDMQYETHRAPNCQVVPLPYLLND